MYGLHDVRFKSQNVYSISETRCRLTLFLMFFVLILCIQNVGLKRGWELYDFGWMSQNMQLLYGNG